MGIFSCCNIRRNVFDGGLKQIEQKFNGEYKSLHEARVTAVALSLIALLLTGVGLCLMGIGTTPSTMHVGFGIFPYLAGSQIFLLGGGVLLGSIVFAGIAIYHGSRVQHLRKIHTSISDTEY